MYSGCTITISDYTTITNLRDLVVAQFNFGSQYVTIKHDLCVLLHLIQAIFDFITIGRAKIF